MVSKQVMFTVLLVAATAATMAEATRYVVGDAKGWTINFNYSAWAEDKVFHVGDTLVFNYPVGKHNVYKVNGTDFKECSVPSALVSEPLTTGYDVITIATPGRKWYLCGVGEGKHCLTGQKLFINVQAPPAPPPTWWAPEPATWTDAPAASPAAWTDAPTESPVSWTDAPVESPAYSWTGAPAASPAAWTDAPEESPAYSWTAPPTDSPAEWTDTPAASPAWERYGPSPRKMVGWPTPAPSAYNNHY